MHSAKFDNVMTYYKRKFWSVDQVRNAVKKNWITAEEFQEITGETY